MRIKTNEEALEITLKILNQKTQHLIKMVRKEGIYSLDVSLAITNVERFVRRYKIKDYN